MKFENKLLGLATLLASLSLVAPACGGRSSYDGGTEEEGTGSGESNNSEETAEWGGESEGTASSTTTTSSTTDDTAGFVTDSDTNGTTTTTDTGPQPNGSPCSADDECESEICVQIPALGGVCSECETDQQCMDSGEGLNCTLGAQQYFACADGSLGTMCMSDAACMDGLHCATVLDLGGLFNDQFCSECGEDTDCADGQLCTPNFDLGTFAGFRECVDAASVMQDGMCDSNDQCASGFCSQADLMGFLQVGVCGECLMDGDCAMGQTCMDASIDLMGGGLSGSTCG